MLRAPPRPLVPCINNRTQTLHAVICTYCILNECFAYFHYNATAQTAAQYLIIIHNHKRILTFVNSFTCGDRTQINFGQEQETRLGENNRNGKSDAPTPLHRVCFLAESISEFASCAKHLLVKFPDFSLESKLVEMKIHKISIYNGR